MQIRQGNGFTLIEVVFAIVILATSLTILLGLQSASVSKGLRDRNQLQAMLVARNILAAIELEEQPENRDVQDTVVRVLDSLDATIDSKALEEQYLGMHAHLIVEEWDNPPALEPLNLSINILKRIYLKIFWGESPDDQFEIVYFVPNGL